MKDKRMNISLDEASLKRLKELAESEHKSVSQWIRDKIWETKAERNAPQTISDKRFT